ncbi:alpha/beta fold hydrolase [Acidisoma sp. C75]
MKIAANGITLHASDEGAGPLALVFLHYWGGTARSWQPVIAALPADLRKIALDARGWGGSDRPATGYDMATMADDVAAAIGALGLSRYVLIGHSMGGKVAQLLASRQPQGLAGLILVAPSPAQGKSLAPEEREAMAAAYAEPEAAGWTVDTILCARPLPPALRAEVIAGSLAGAAAAKHAWPQAGIGEDVSADLARIAVPVLVIGGEKDQVDQVEMLRARVLPVLPTARLSIVPDAGHLLPLEAPAELAAQIQGFVAGLAEVPRPSAMQQATGPAAMRPEDLPPLFDAAFNAGDLDAVLALFHPAATMRMTDGTLVTGGGEALRAALGGLLALKPRLQNHVRRVLVSEDQALILAEWQIVMPGPGEASTARGVATQVAGRGADGAWRLRIANPLGVSETPLG